MIEAVVKWLQTENLCFEYREMRLRWKNDRLCRRNMVFDKVEKAIDV